MSDAPRKFSPVVTGARFGFLTAVERHSKSPDGHWLWLFSCDCGNQCVRATNSIKNSARTKTYISCGCMAGELNKTHGQRNTAAYKSWLSAKRRCTNVSAKDYSRYGGIGISMCEEWQNSFADFIRDMGPRPNGTSLDRINPFGNYEPGNCRWATVETQANNKRRPIITVEFNDSEVTAKQFAGLMGITHGAALKRIGRGRLYG